MYFLKKYLFAALIFFVCAQTNLIAAETQQKESRQSAEAKVFTGFDGGMMLHTGYQYGTIQPIGYQANGAPFGLGGVIRAHLGKHWRLGGEGYVSYLHLMDNGSYVKNGWGGVVGDFYWTFGKFMPYVGVMVGGGVRRTLLMMEGSTSTPQQWEPLGESYFDKTGYFAVNPNIGCEFIISSKFHLSLKADWLCAIDKTLLNPCGPRIYIGFIFTH